MKHWTNDLNTKSIRRLFVRANMRFIKYKFNACLNSCLLSSIRNVKRSLYIAKACFLKTLEKLLNHSSWAENVRWKRIACQSTEDRKVGREWQSSPRMPRELFAIRDAPCSASSHSSISACCFIAIQWTMLWLQHFWCGFVLSLPFCAMRLMSYFGHNPRGRSCEMDAIWAGEKQMADKNIAIVAYFIGNHVELYLFLFLRNAERNWGGVFLLAWLICGVDMTIVSCWWAFCVGKGIR